MEAAKGMVCLLDDKKSFFNCWLVGLVTKSRNHFSGEREVLVSVN